MLLERIWEPFANFASNVFSVTERPFSRKIHGKSIFVSSFYFPIDTFLYMCEELLTLATWVSGMEFRDSFHNRESCRSQMEWVWTGRSSWIFLSLCTPTLHPLTSVATCPPGICVKTPDHTVAASPAYTPLADQGVSTFLDNFTEIHRNFVLLLRQMISQIA